MQRVEKWVKGILQHKIMILIFTVIVIVLISATVRLLNVKKNEVSQLGDNCVLTVDLQPVSMEEYKAKMVENVPDIFVYFHNKYGVQQGSGFWTNPIGGEVPLDKLKAKTLSDIVRIKVEQTLGKEKGVVKDISYSNFLKNLDIENKRRQDAIKNNKVFYGTSSLSATNYFRTLHNDMVEEVKDQLAKKNFFIKDDHIQKLYEQDKEKLYKIQDMIKVKKISVSVDKVGTVLELKQNNEAKAAADKIKFLLNKGTNLEDIHKEFNGNSLIKVHIEDQVFSKENSEKGDDTYYLLVSLADGLEVGKVSDVIEGDNAYFILLCTERSGNGYKPLNEVKDLVIARYVTQKYNEMIDLRVHKAKVIINRSVYDQIAIN